MKAIVLGADGMLGHKIFQTLDSQFDDLAGTIRGKKEEGHLLPAIFDSKNIFEDISTNDLPYLKSILESTSPDFIINCIGIIKQRATSNDKLLSMYVNAMFPHWLTSLSSNWGGKVIHFSTDCIFSGSRGAYIEDSPPDATDVYGQSKAIGELVSHNGLTLRTSIIGRELKYFSSLLEWFLAQEGKTIPGFSEVIYSGVTTNYLAKTVGFIIQKYPTLYGTYQIASNPISKYNLLNLIKKHYKTTVEIVRTEFPICNRSLIGSKFTKETKLIVPEWDILIKEMANDPTPYKSWKQHV
jgi:dTDP-4-dehydrorhamnose reductase